MDLGPHGAHSESLWARSQDHGEQWHHRGLERVDAGYGHGREAAQCSEQQRRRLLDDDAGLELDLVCLCRGHGRGQLRDSEGLPLGNPVCTDHGTDDCDDDGHGTNNFDDDRSSIDEEERNEDRDDPKSDEVHLDECHSEV